MEGDIQPKHEVMGGWVVGTRIIDSLSNRQKMLLLIKHAGTKYRGTPGGMKNETVSEFIRFLINYYYAREIKGR